jgi:hypothetical protein
MIDYHEAVREMHKGNVVKYVGTVNGNVMTDKGWSWCMQRGCIFAYKDGKVVPKSAGNMVYDPDFRYVLTGETVDPRGWPIKPRNYPKVKVLDKETISKLSYSRIGRNNV